MSSFPLLDCFLDTTTEEKEEEKIENSFFQFSLAVIFYFNNYDYVSKTDFSFEVLGYLVTQTLVSLILSAISIFKGIVVGIKIICTVKAWKTPQEEMVA